MSHPLVELIQSLLLTKQDDIFNVTNNLCFGLVVKEGRQCRQRVVSGRMNAVLKLKDLEDEVLDHEGEAFYEDIQNFLRHTHCPSHILAVLEKFHDLKRHRLPRPSASSATQARQKAFALSVSPDPAGVVSAEDKETPALNSDWDPAHSDADSLAADSPEAERNCLFDMPSPASTAATTPGTTPHRDGDDQSDPSSPPNTPTPVTRRKTRGNSSHRGQGQADGIDDEKEGATEEKNELAEVLAEHHNLGAEVLGQIDRRFKSVKRKKWPLMAAIEKRFSYKDGLEGKVYVWTHKKIPRLVKIGFTQQDSDGRRVQRNNCYARSTDTHWESEVPFVGAYRVEQIVHKNLNERNISLVSCAVCEAAHREWFEMDVEEAVVVVRQWTMFVSRAYGSDGRLNELGRRLMDRLCGINTGALQRALEAENGVPAGTAHAISEESQSESDDEGEPKVAPTLVDKLVGVPQATEETSTTTSSIQVPTAVSDPFSANAPAASHEPVSAGEPQRETASAWPDRLRSRPSVDEGEQPTWRRAWSATKRVSTGLSKRLSVEKSGDCGSKARGKEDRGEDQLFASLVKQFYSTELGQRLSHSSDKGGEQLKRGASRILYLLKSPRFRDI